MSGGHLLERCPKRVEDLRGFLVLPYADQLNGAAVYAELEKTLP